jgi:hypothetical protein
MLLTDRELKKCLAVRKRKIHQPWRLVAGIGLNQNAMPQTALGTVVTDVLWPKMTPDKKFWELQENSVGSIASFKRQISEWHSLPARPFLSGFSGSLRLPCPHLHDFAVCRTCFLPYCFQPRLPGPFLDISVDTMLARFGTSPIPYLK